MFRWSTDSADAGPRTATTPLVISGVVMEPGANQPVADAEITVSEFVRQPLQGYGSGYRLRARVTTSTEFDFDGLSRHARS